MAETIYPPIIDNTVSAFVINEGRCGVSFYFQNDEQEIDTNYIIAKIETNGEPAVDGYLIYSISYSDASVVTSAIKKQEYMITIHQSHLKSGSFQIDRPISVSLKSIKKQTGDLISQLIAAAKNPVQVKSLVEGNADEFSQWSQAEIKTPIPRPTLSISAAQDGTSMGTIAEDTTHEIGSFEQLYVAGTLTYSATTTDAMSWYQMRLYDTSTPSWKKLEDSGRCFPNRDTASRTFEHAFKLNLAINPNLVKSGLTLEVIYQTISGYTKVQTYNFIRTDAVTRAIDETIQFENQALEIVSHNDKGTVTIGGEVRIVDGIDARSGYLVLLRRRKDTTQWEEILEMSYKAERNNVSRFSIEDKTVESGVPYEYKVEFYYVLYDVTTGKGTKYYSSNSQSSEAIGIVVLDDIFLTTKDLQLRVVLNPQVSSYKRNVIDNVTATLGGAYPFIRRNGAQIYRSFSLNGLVAFEQEIMENSDSADALFTYDENNHSTPPNIMQWDSIHRGTKNPENYTYPYNFISSENSLFFRGSYAIDLSYYYNSNLDTATKYQIYNKIFRDKVMDFLYSDQVILYRSQQEGNIFIKLTNISFTPNAQLGRRVWSFSATATEILPTIAENYKKYFSSLAEDEYFTIKDIYIKAPSDLSKETIISGLENGNAYVSAEDIIELATAPDAQLTLYQNQVKYQ